MLISENMAVTVRKKRAVEWLTTTQLASVLNVDRRTLANIEQGYYATSKRIYHSVMEWLVD